MSDEDQALNLYIKDIECRTHAEVCMSRVPGFREQFEVAYAAWHERNRADVEHGRVLAEARGMVGSEPPSIQAFARHTAGVLEMTADDDCARRCFELIRGLSTK
jgi:hypothetical protein